MSVWQCPRPDCGFAVAGDLTPAQWDDPDPVLEHEEEHRLEDDRALAEILGAPDRDPGDDVYPPPPVSPDRLWPAAAAALFATSPDPRAEHLRSRVELPATPVPMPPVLVLGDDVRVDRVHGSIAGTRVVLVTDADSRVLATLRVTPDAAAALVSGLVPAAAASLRLIDNILDGLEQHPQVRA